MASGSTYDFIIIGGGTAGCVLANRLSEDDDVCVLLLEAGANRNDDMLVRCPCSSQAMHSNSSFDWQFASEPQEGLKGRIIDYPRGKLVGGSSAINSHALVYPCKTEIDRWSDLGNPGWDWEHLLPYYRKFQTLNPPLPDVAKDLKIDLQHEKRTTGPIQASYPLNRDCLRQAWVETFERLGYAASDGPLSGKLGALTTTAAIGTKDRERSHSGVAYLKPVTSRANLHIVVEAHAEKVLFEVPDDGDALATGVQYLHKGTLLTAKTKGEVIVCAGSFKSPQILELSGIGEKQILSKSGIDCIYHNPNVGENLQDHLNCSISLEVIESIQTADSRLDSETKELDKIKYDTTREGPNADAGTYSFAYASLFPFLSPAEHESLKTFISKEIVSTITDYPIFLPIHSPSEASATLFLTSKQRPVPSTPLAPGNYIGLAAMLAHPLSRGSVHIISSSPLQAPAINPCYLSHPLDMHLLARHLLALERLATFSPLKDCLKAGGRRIPAKKLETLVEAEEWIRRAAQTNHHPVGTCAMMKGGVVDSKLRVSGTRNVRVADASVMPVIVRGNVLSTVYAVAERAADIIQGDWKTEVRVFPSR